MFLLCVFAWYILQSLCGGLNMLLGCFIIMCTFFAMWVLMMGAKLKEKYFFKGWRLKPNVRLFA